MEIVLYILIYIMGVFLGSFFTLSIYRIPKKQDILYTRSYCPSCKHKLVFLDLFPILSYIALKGRCRYCKEKIGSRYIIIESISGLFYLLFVMSLKINIFEITIYQIVYLLFITLVIATLFILGGIEKETGKFQKSVLNFGFIVELMYITYLYVLHYNIYRYIIYFTIYIILYLLSRMKKEQINYTVNMLMLCISIVVATNEIIVAISMLITAIYALAKLLINRKKEMKLPIAYYLCFFSMFITLIYNFLIR